MLLRLKSLCRVSGTDSDSMRELKTSFLSAMEEKYIVHPLHKLSTVLNPAYKFLSFATADDHDHVYWELRQQVNQFPLPAVDENTGETSSAEPPQEKQKVEVECDLLAEYKTSVRAAESLECTDTRHELDKYLSLPVRDSNPDSFWKLHKEQLPILAVLARKLLAIPATSRPSERVFCVCGATVNERRAHMNTGTLEQLVFLKYNICVRKIKWLPVSFACTVLLYFWCSTLY